MKQLAAVSRDCPCDRISIELMDSLGLTDEFSGSESSCSSCSAN